MATPKTAGWTTIYTELVSCVVEQKKTIRFKSEPIWGNFLFRLAEGDAQLGPEQLDFRAGEVHVAELKENAMVSPAQVGPRLVGSVDVLL